MTKLAQGQLTHGDGGPGYLSFALTNLGDLPTGHPLKISGLQTDGYTTFFYIKTRRTDPDTSAIVTKSNGVAGGLTVSSATSGLIDLSPTNTSAIAVAGGTTKAWFKLVIEKNDGSERYTLEQNEFTVVDG